MSSMVDRAVDGIRTMIVEGGVQPGDKLPREADLASHLDVSRGSLREAVRALAYVGVLDVRQGDGTFVSSLDGEQLLRGMGLVADLAQDRTVLDLFEVRRFLEPSATAIAAVRRDDRDLETLHHHQDRIRSAETTEGLVEADMDFHQAIAEATGNDTLRAMMDNLSSKTMRARIWRVLAQEGIAERARAEHADILRHIEAREPELARCAATIHIEGVERWLRGALEDAGETS